MKRRNLLFTFILLGLSACSSPTEPRMPQPDPDEREDPDEPAFAPELPLSWTGGGMLA